MQDVDSEIAVHLKRLGRKDPTTKVLLDKLQSQAQQKTSHNDFHYASFDI